MTHSQIKSELHPFGGCNQLLRYYQLVGCELLELEANGGIGSFRESVATVPVEVLESYLEDLLDSSIKDERLHIKRETSWVRTIMIPLIGVLGGVIIGLYAVSLGTSLIASFGITALVSFPFAMLMQLHPKLGLTRRMTFAQVLSSEIARRRGRDKDGDKRGAQIILADMLRPQLPLKGAARNIFH